MARMNIAAFVARSRDDVLRFRIAVERACAKRKGLVAEEQTYDEWLRLFCNWSRSELRRPRSSETTAKTFRPK